MHMVLNEVKKYERGSSMVLVLVVVSVIIIIATTLATVSLNALKLTYYSAFQNNAYYANDALIQEVLFKLDDISYGAESAAYNAVVTDQTYKETWEWDTYQKALRDATRLDTSNPQYKSEADVTAMVSKVMELEFKKAFLNYLLLGEDDFGVYSDIVVDDYTLYNKVGENVVLTDIADYQLKIIDSASYQLDRSFVDLLEAVSFNPGDGVEDAIIAVSSHFEMVDEGIVIDVETRAKYNSIQKEMVFQASMEPPVYTFAVQLEEPLGFYENDLLNYALVAQGNIVSLGGDATIDGNLYCYGEYPEEERADTEEMGGVIAGYNGDSDPVDLKVKCKVDFGTLWDSKGTLTVGGNIGTRSAVKVQENNSTLSTTGNTYSEFVVIEPHSNGASIRVDGNAYAYQDVIVASDDGEINVGNAIWCFFNEDPDHVVTDRSGSIIVNPFGDPSLDGEKVTADKVFVDGQAFVRAHKDGTYYKTNESLSNAKYAWFYNKDMRTEGESASAFTDDIQFSEYESDYNDDSVKLAEKTDGTTDESFLFKKFNEVYEYDSYSTVNEEERQKIDIDTFSTGHYEENYILGTALTNGKLTWDSTKYSFSTTDSAYGSGEEFMEQTTFDIDKPDVIKEQGIDMATSVLGRRDYSFGVNQNDFTDHANTGNTMFASFINLDAKVTNRVLEQYYDQLFYFNADENTDLFINKPPSLTLNDDDEWLSNANDITGVIITAGDVYIYAPENETVNVTGTIIAKGNIVLYGPGEKHIEFNKATVYSMIGQDYDYAEAVNGFEGREFKGGEEGLVDSNPEKVGLVYNNDFVPYTTAKRGSAPYSVQGINPDLADAIRKEGSKGYEIQKWHEK